MLPLATGSKITFIICRSRYPFDTEIIAQHTLDIAETSRYLLSNFILNQTISILQISGIKKELACGKGVKGVLVEETFSRHASRRFFSSLVSNLSRILSRGRPRMVHIFDNNSTFLGREINKTLLTPPPN